MIKNEDNNVVEAVLKYALDAKREPGQKLYRTSVCFIINQIEKTLKLDSKQGLDITKIMELWAKMKGHHFDYERIDKAGKKLGAHIT